MNIIIKFEDFIKEIIKFMIENDMLNLGDKNESVNKHNPPDQ